MSLTIYVAGLLVVGAVAWAVAGPFLAEARVVARRQGDDPERYRLEKERDLAYSAIKEAEFDHQMGKLSVDDYALLRRKYEGRALEALAALERLG